jgi:dolichyl-phosphate-mannose-protein mannosyltransferase
MSHARKTVNLPVAWQMQNPRYSLKIVFGLIFVTLIGGLFRWVRLAEPKAVVFDEIYYAVDAQSLLQSGVEKTVVENVESEMLNGNSNIFIDEGSFVAHPPTGKWIIAIGEYLFGLTPFGWRFSAALFGTLLIVLTFLVARRLLKSNLFALFAASLVALDGLAIVMSRIALLDGFLIFFIMLSLLFFLIDIDKSKLKVDNQDLIETKFGPIYSWHSYRWLLGVSLGLAISTKWSGIYFLAVFGLLAIMLDVFFRSQFQPKKLFIGHILKDWWLIFIQLPLTAFAVYLISWTGWFISSIGWGKNISQNAFISLFEYHKEIWNFHTQLTQDHNYEAYAAGWPILLRPTAFYYQETNLNCASDLCASEILAIGNPAIWWIGVIALVTLLIWFIREPKFEIGLVIILFLAGWLPWFAYPDRPTFYFYAIIMMPFIAIAIALLFRQLSWIFKSNGISNWTIGSLTTIYLFIVLGLTIFFLPVWTAISIPKNEWLWRMWFDIWI